MQLDKVLTVAIGRNGPDGTPMPDADWAGFKRSVEGLLTSHGATIVANVGGEGVGSDGVNEWEPEDTHVFVAINPTDDIEGRKLYAIRFFLAALLRFYGQSSACFAYDEAHEPVFNTPDGSRPS